MKLLTKTEIEKQKVIERKVEIDQGMTLAKKIDSLRETASKEESNLAKFRIESLKTIKEEIDEKIRQRNSLESEIVQKRKHLQNLWNIIKEIETIQ